ncbi:MAG: sulfite exporter TauE/SafE family protein [Phycisphaerae bacterium]
MAVLQLIVIGLGAGLIGGMLGVGGSIVMIPAMTEVLGPDQHLYQAAAMMVNFFVVVPAVYQHSRARAIDKATVARIVPLAVAGVIVGVGVSELPVFASEGEVYLRGLFGLFLLVVGVSDLIRLRRSAEVAEPLLPETTSSGGMIRRIGWSDAALVAVPTGFVAGLFGVGGGLLAVPLQHRFLRMPIRTAIANSAAVIIATSLIGAFLKNYAYLSRNMHWETSFILAAVLIPTAIIGSSTGSRLTHRLPTRAIKFAFLVLLIGAAARLTYKASQSIAQQGRAAQVLRSHTSWTEMERHTGCVLVQLSG